MSTANAFRVTISSDLSGSVEEWWEDYLRVMRRRRQSEYTVTLKRAAFERFWRWVKTDDPEAVTDRTVNEWTESLQAEGLAPATVSIYWRSLSPFWSWWAKETGLTNPFAGADTPTVDAEAPPVIHEDDIRALLETCSGRGFEDRRDTAILRVLIDTGVRLGELVGVAVPDWDRRSDLLRVDGKTGPRVVPLSPSTGEALARYVRLRSSHPKAGVDALWLGRKGGLTRSAVGQMLNRRCTQAGLPRVGPHAFRHTFSHEFRAAGGSEGDLMYLAGWSSTAMAHRYGKSAAAQRAREAHQRIRLGDRY